MSTYAFDIDGTICNNTDGMYAKAEPFTQRINEINKIYDEGHKVIYFTARGMNRFNGDVKMVNDIFYDFTERQLKLWGCKYHQLILGKPSYDLLVDDKAQSDMDFFAHDVWGTGEGEEY